MASWMFAALLLVVAPSARAEEWPGVDPASVCGGGNELMTYVQVGNAFACEYDISAIRLPLPPFISIVGYVQCRLWPDAADP